MDWKCEKLTPGITTFIIHSHPIICSNKAISFLPNTLRWQRFCVNVREMFWPAPIETRPCSWSTPWAGPLGPVAGSRCQQTDEACWTPRPPFAHSGPGWSRSTGSPEMTTRVSQALRRGVFTWESPNFSVALTCLLPGLSRCCCGGCSEFFVGLCHLFEALEKLLHGVRVHFLVASVVF